MIKTKYVAIVIVALVLLVLFVSVSVFAIKSDFDDIKRSNNEMNMAREYVVSHVEYSTSGSDKIIAINDACNKTISVDKYHNRDIYSIENCRYTLINQMFNKIWL